MKGKGKSSGENGDDDEKRPGHRCAACAADWEDGSGMKTILERLLAAKNPSHLVLLNSVHSLQRLIQMMQSMLGFTDADRVRLNGVIDRMWDTMTAAGVEKVGEAVLVVGSMALGFVGDLEKDLVAGDGESGEGQGQNAAEENGSERQTTVASSKRLSAGVPMRGLEKDQ